ncbi:hypothetical protein OG474_21270 [Kribbella sp. NBC_01505]|uniref:hypothetical protein n=1 Tax=Kribbella sp. NBC_01505 TaxID=2903580 RepID=UPI003868B513
MRRFVALAAAAVLLTGGLATPAWGATPEAPRNVQVSWAGDQIRVTWQDDGEANVIRKKTTTGDGVEVDTQTADEPNEVLLSSDFPETDEARIIVLSRGTDGRLSAWGQSPTFDTRRPVRPEMRTADMRDDLSVRLWWYREARIDYKDPLDRPEAQWLKATVAGPAAGQKKEYTLPLEGGDSMFDVPAPAPLSTITLAAGNEWGTTAGTGPFVRVGVTRAETAVVPRQIYGYAVMNLTTLRYQCNCPDDKNPGKNAVEVEIQARPNTSAPWTKIGRNAGQPGTPFFTEAEAVGSRQYRIFVPAYGNSWFGDIPIVVMRPVSTAPKTSLTFANFGTAAFSPASAPVGATVKLTVQLLPKADMNAALQRWDGKQWRHTRGVPLVRGVATIPIRASGRGTTTKYRILTPRVTVKGLPIEPTTSKPFTLTVR